MTMGGIDRHLESIWRTLESMFDAEDIFSLRGIGDPMADEVVLAEVRGDSTHGAASILAALTNSLRDLDDSPVVAGWVNRVESTPPWIDDEMVARGQDVFAEWSLDIVTSLFCASLPFAYAAAQGVEVLERISLLADPKTVARRIAETGQMLLDVSEQGALAPGGRGHRTARIVRLLHAVIRVRLTMTTPPSSANPASVPWDSEVFGVPINQEDLLGTLLSFTSVVFRAFDNMGIPFELEAQESYLQLWAAIGDLLGIASAEFVVRPADAEALTDLIAKELHAPSVAGFHLMDVLMGEMEISMPWGLRKLPRTLVRHLGGDQVADILGVESSAWWGGLLPALAALNRVTDHFPSGRAVLQAPSRLLGRSMIRMWIDRSILGEGPNVHIGTHMISRLGLHTVADGSVIGLRGRLRGHRRAVRLRRRQRATHPPVSTGARSPGSLLFEES
jgi:hypothetical protein